ncbi:hypothetical protein AGDE_11860 [Angomonas deanei]|uniref:EF-hand domain-containing protein n=1 Tax=Angomonas deanei TaxID=59799 RepID=A0A7G2CBX6_9TRYP|nr:hypothetical protein AGDE_11860 [Angomonas deanei]CAD2217019.1 hypothetical protein, conserved [Angomonas deanei]|eukprot:EPY25347.1 hypothetical protein AGDE_11860 [Angomonas deanei]
MICGVQRDTVFVLPYSGDRVVCLAALEDGTLDPHEYSLRHSITESRSSETIKCIQGFFVNMYKAAQSIQDSGSDHLSVKEMERLYLSYDPNIVSVKQPTLDLLPQLDRTSHHPPFRVDTQVLARRFGCGTCLFPARIVATQYDCTYTLQYEDGGCDFGVLHCDILPVDESEAEPCSVRDMLFVSIQRQHHVTVVECCGNGRYRGVLVDEPGTVVEFRKENIMYITPLLCEALFSDNNIVNWFLKLDSNRSGGVAWKDVRHLLLNLEGFGKPLSFAEVGAMQRDLCIISGRMEPQFLSKIPVQEEEMRLNFHEFEIILLKALNRL